MITEVLDHWVAADWIRPLDRELARFIVAKSPGCPAHLELLIALVSYQSGQGHMCLDLARLVADADDYLGFKPSPVDTHLDRVTPSQIFGHTTVSAVLAWLDADCVATDGSQPLVVAGQSVYLQRFWSDEIRIAEAINARLVERPEMQTTQWRRALDQLFHSKVPSDPASLDLAVDFQKLACAVAARHKFGVITGGPGTGKTTTVVRLLAALQAERLSAGLPAAVIRLAAPTGKAAARLNESIGNALHGLPLAELSPDLTIDLIPSQVTTIHRLLKPSPNSNQFQHGRSHRLALDWLVIDEASMIDVALMTAVIDALPASAGLILIGDKDQLASVEAGAIMGQLCQRAETAGYSALTAQWLNSVMGSAVPANLITEQPRQIDQAVSKLRVSYRFTEDSGIKQLADQINQGDVSDALVHALRSQQWSDLAMVRPGQLMSVCVDAYAAYLRRVHEKPLSDTSQAWDAYAGDVLSAFDDFQVLAASRSGRFGVDQLNRAIASGLSDRGLIDLQTTWYPGRPVMVTTNDYGLGLFNGDIGIALPQRQPSGAVDIKVAFASANAAGGIRWVSPARLQRYEDVFAMTVHKSQGSEFGHVLLAMPEIDLPVLTRELLYTAVTRARHRFSIAAGNLKSFQAASTRRVNRSSRLASLLA